MVAIQSVQSVELLACWSCAISSIGLGHLRFAEVAGHGEERFFERKNLVLEGVVGLRGALRGLGLVECLDLFFERLQGGEAWHRVREMRVAS